jgi:hypothetical protein
MDGYAAEMIALIRVREPSQALARPLPATATAPPGSMHIVDLPDLAAARPFALDEPSHQASVYWDMLLRRWRNTLGRGTLRWRRSGLAEVGTVCDRRIVRRHRVARLRLPDTMDDFGGSARR